MTVADPPRLRAGQHVTVDGRPAIVFVPPQSYESDLVVVAFTDARGGKRIAAGFEVER